MKLKTIILSAAVATLASSCSLLSQHGVTLKGSSADQKNTTATQVATSTSTTATADTPKQAATAKATQKSKGNKKAASTLKSDTTPTQKTGNTASDIKAITDPRLNGEWIIISVNNLEIPMLDDMPYINFENATGRFYMSNTCNILNGDFSPMSNGKLYFSNTLSTMKLCPDVEFESAIAAIVSTPDAYGYKIDNIGHESYLTLLDKKGKETMKARKHNMDFLNGNWNIVRAGSIAITDEDATLFIDINELKVHGNTGCNYFNGQIFINPAKTNAIDFNNLISTRMACPKSEQESAILLALEETVSAILGNDDEVMLLDNNGHELMILHRGAKAE